ncbi:MAG: hypothetical protein QM733_03500 [Ilumatobacteraceae bacterium]
MSLEDRLMMSDSIPRRPEAVELAVEVLSVRAWMEQSKEIGSPDRLLPELLPEV